jgi:hypothetical protein
MEKMDGYKLQKYDTFFSKFSIKGDNVYLETLKNSR